MARGSETAICIALRITESLLLVQLPFPQFYQLPVVRLEAKTSVLAQLSSNTNRHKVHKKGCPKSIRYAPGGKVVSEMASPSPLKVGSISKYSWWLCCFPALNAKLVAGMQGCVCVCVRTCPHGKGGEQLGLAVHGGPLNSSGVRSTNPPGCQKCQYNL